MRERPLCLVYCARSAAGRRVWGHLCPLAVAGRSVSSAEHRMRCPRVYFIDCSGTWRTRRVSPERPRWACGRRAVSCVAHLELVSPDRWPAPTCKKNTEAFS